VKPVGYEIPHGKQKKYYEKYSIELLTLPLLYVNGFLKNL
jgi:hypothetical protein